MRQLLTTIATLAAVVALAACSSTTPEPTPPPAAPEAAQSSTQDAPPADLDPTDEPADDAAAEDDATEANISEILAAAGITCDGDFTAETKCQLDGEKVTFTPEPFADSATLRGDACTAGYVNENYLVAVGADYWLAADSNDTAEALAAELNIDAVKYCP